MFKAIETWKKKREIETRRLIVAEGDIGTVITALSGMGKNNAKNKTYRMGRHGDGKYYFVFDCTNDAWTKFVSGIGRALKLTQVNYESWYELV